jgi:polyphosphate kinase
MTVEPTKSAAAEPSDLPAAPLINRELSWLDFNRRVLAEAENGAVPLLERVKFAAITSNNLDEFFMVRGGGIKALMRAGLQSASVDGMLPKQQWRSVRKKARALLDDLYALLQKELIPKLAKEGLRIVGPKELSSKESAELEAYFSRQVEPLLTPLATDPGHPFPFLANLSVSLAVQLATPKGEESWAFLKVPPSVPRLVEVPGDGKLVPVEQLIGHFAGRIFPGLQVRATVPLRVIRNADIALREDEVQDLLKSVESELRRRERRETVWMEIGEGADASLIDLLSETTGTPKDDIYVATGLLKVSDLMQLAFVKGKSSLRDEPFNPRIPAPFASSEDIFSIVRRGDILLHRPYDSFGAVVEFVQASADDPDVLAIKMTLYRTDRDSPIVAALAKAGRAGKQVTAIVELQARFDESKNIEWARQLELAGVQVVYGLVGIKTHCKVCLVVRREGDGLRRYVHLSTGNYNARTAALYTDIDLFTADDDFGDDAAQVMNILTGFSIASVQDVFDGRAAGMEWKRLTVSPMDYHRRVIELIRREIDHAKAGRGGAIWAKLNALVDRTVIRTLYEASRAGVKIDLVVRGICCLIPGLPGISDNIRVVAVIDRFLEHSRAFCFGNGGDREVYVSSGDWMPRNFFRRVELTFPIRAKALQSRIVDEIMATCLGDDVKGWELGPDGVYRRRTPGAEPLRSQQRFIETARSEAYSFGPYEQTIFEPGSFRKKMKKAKKKKK